MERKLNLGVLKPALSASATFKIITILGLVFLLSTYISCSRGPASAEPGAKETDKNIAANSTPIENSGRLQDAAAICDRIPDIKLYPFHGDKGEDPTYDAFMDAGEASVPCLIKNVTDTTRTPDPRETLKFPETTVGDIAYFLLIDITKLGFTELLPREVQDDYKDNGVWAYYEYVRKVEHRRELQNKLYEWYRKRYGKDAREALASPR